MLDEPSQKTYQTVTAIIVIVFLVLIAVLFHIAYQVADVTVEIMDTGAKILLEKTKKYDKELETLQRKFKKLEKEMERW